MATICSYMLLNTGKEKEGIEMASNATNQIKSNQIKSNQIKSNQIPHILLSMKNMKHRINFCFKILILIIL